ncbi:hypothetical protein [Streptomyces sp. MNP-20]|uniref:hypothetical protein n=1 Tax=Streptomyces sp. MNP-20 TaxID=2721165 RepID=UPI0015555FB5|nr:hypothetical protein [Streptomyces sp. MNP-20]
MCAPKYLGADVDSDAKPEFTQGLDVAPAGVRNMARASRDAGVRAEYFERAAAALEQQLAEGQAVYSAPGEVARLRAPR